VRVGTLSQQEAKVFLCVINNAKAGSLTSTNYSRIFVADSRSKASFSPLKNKP
jgi:hypothetical protein